MSNATQEMACLFADRETPSDVTEASQPLPNY